MATSGPSFTVRCQIAVYLSVNDQLLKGGVRTCPPFEYHPGEGVSDNAQRLLECEVQTGWD
ncbi:hypothetical protein AWA1501_02260 [Lactiplantibacillus pentosus]|nr:hypothetical protein AWA1501_02260 [Lactiplantibacillus pentosus]